MLFDIVFGLFGAFEQLMMLLMGVIFLLVGVGISGAGVWMGVRGRRVPAIVTGIRLSQEARKDDDDDKDQNDKPAQPLSESLRKSPGATVGALLIMALFALIPLVFFGIGAWKAWDQAALRMTGIETTGTIIGYEAHSGDEGTTYAARVSYTDLSGNTVSVEDSFSSSSKYESAGAVVPVWYDPANPSHVSIGSLFHNLFLPVLFMAIPLIFVGIIALAGFAQRRAKGGQGQKLVNTYYPVVRYRAEDGTEAEAVYKSGTNYIGGHLPGQRLRVAVDPEDSGRVDSPGMLWFVAIIGLVFAAPGLFILHQAVTSFELSWYTPLVLLGIGAKVYTKARPKISQEAMSGGIAKIRGAVADIKQQVKQKATGKPKEDASMPGRLMTTPEIQDAVARQDRTMLLWSPVILMVCIGLILGGVHFGESMVNLTAHGVRAEGTVTDIRSRDSDNGTTYYAVIEYRDTSGGPRKLNDSLSASTPIFKRGDAVTVLYDPATPEQTAMVDRGIWNWTAPVLMGGIGSALLILSLKGILSSLRRRARAGRLSQGSTVQR